MNTLSRIFAPAALAVVLGFGAMIPAPAQAQDDLVRVLVDVADVVFRSGNPYYRYGNDGYNDRLVAGRDRYGRLVYYRVLPRHGGYRYDRYNVNYYPGRYDHDQRVKCNKHGKCKVSYYDPRYDRDHHDDHDDWDDHRGHNDD